MHEACCRGSLDKADASAGNASWSIINGSLRVADLVLQDSVDVGQQQQQQHQASRSSNSTKLAS